VHSLLLLHCHLQVLCFTASVARIGWREYLKSKITASRYGISCDIGTRDGVLCKIFAVVTASAAISAARIVAVKIFAVVTASAAISGG
jgi:hypothetical protein